MAHALGLVEVADLDVREVRPTHVHTNTHANPRFGMNRSFVLDSIGAWSRGQPRSQEALSPANNAFKTKRPQVCKNAENQPSEQVTTRA